MAEGALTQSFERIRLAKEIRAGQFAVVEGDASLTLSIAANTLTISADWKPAAGGAQPSVPLVHMALEACVYGASESKLISHGGSASLSRAVCSLAGFVLCWDISLGPLYDIPAKSRDPLVRMSALGSGRWLLMVFVLWT